MLRPQDVILCLYLNINVSEHTYAEVAKALKISVSSAHAAMHRARQAMLLDDSHRPIRSNLLEFLKHGLRYVFYAERGGVTRGVPTGAAAPQLQNALASTPENSPVWPCSTGRARGYALDPLYRTVPEVAMANPSLHAALAATDLLRIGAARERTFAGYFLEKLLHHDDNFADRTR